MFRFTFAFIVLISVASTGQRALADPSYVPDRRIVVSRDLDFYGSDLQNIFDTTYDACINACLADSNCTAFTFNTRSNSCFPKSEISDKQPYDGALSAEVVTTPADTQDLGRTRAPDIGFLGVSDLNRAQDQAKNIGRVHAAGPWIVDDILDAATRRRADGDLLNAMRLTGGALSKADRSDLWIEYARLNSAVEGAKSSETRKYRERAYFAAINGYLRAESEGAQVSALVALSERLEERNRGADMVRALRVAEGFGARADVVTMLDQAIAKYGFRITEHRVENDLADPRLCVDFNEPLVKTGVDYAPYVKMPDSRLAVQAEGNQLCIEGLSHGQRITATFRAGLPAQSGEDLIKDVEITAYVRDRSQSVGFAGRAYVLPRSADAGLPIETVNLDQVDLMLQRVSDRNLLRAIQDNYFGQPLSYWQIDDFSRDVAETIWTGTGDVQNTLNQTMTTRLPIGETLKDQPAGVYALTADLPGADKYDETSSTQWFILSDIGMTSLSGTDGLHVFVRHLNDASAWQNAKVTLLSRANRVLGTAESDAEGYAQFEAGLTRGTSGAAPALVMVETDDDFSFLSLTDPAFDLSDRGVEGRPPAPPIDLFVSTDRGAYRAGETIYVTALARGDVAQALPGLPVTAILIRPDGVEYARHVSTNDKAGGHVFALPLGASVPRGAWRISFKTDLEAPALATAKVLVEDFIPERIDFDLSLPDGPLEPANPAPLRVAATYLFGAPGADLEVEGELRLKPMDEVAGFKGYKFGRHDSPFYANTEYFGGDVTDAAGLAEVHLPIPDQEPHGRPLEADIKIRVLEGSGRPVERTLTHPVGATGSMIGIKSGFEDVVAEGTKASFQVMALDAFFAPTKMEVQWRVNRLRTTYQWYQLGGSWEWEPTTRRTKVAGGEITLNGAPLTIEAPVEWGQYEIIVEQIGGDQVATSTDFYAGWYAPADTSDTPDTLELSLDQPAYRSGDTATLRIVPRYAGTALISVMSNRLISMQVVEVQDGENIIPLTVTDEWGAGAYVTATVIRPSDAPSGQNPARALGLSYAKIDPGAKLLSVTVETANTPAPRAPLDVSVNVTGVAEGETAFVTIAAVDVGILNLTSFASPDPSGHYFGQRRLGMEIRDVYGRLIDGMGGDIGALRSGGDAGASAGFDSPPPTEDLVAFFSGPIAVGADGKASVQFDVPDFNGTVRVMAVAWSSTSVGQAEHDVFVRDPVVVTASLPRFLAPGDQSRLLLEIVHAEGPSGRMGLDVVADGITLTGTVPSGMTLADKATQKLSLPITAGEVGDHDIRVALTTPGGKQLLKSLRIPVRANDPEVSTTQQITLAAGDTLTLGGDLFADMRAGTGSAVVSSGALARFDAPGLLQSLDRYPYGCTEQVTSQAMPLLYFESVSSALGLTPRDKIQERIDQAVAKILTRQDSNGAFGLWRAESGDFWLDAYVSDFLSRARAKGYVVPDLAFRQAMDNLRNRVNYAPDFDRGGEDIAYALLVLAREGAAAMGDLRYYADVKSKAFATPLAAAQIGAALAFYGDQTRADVMFRQAAHLVQAQRSDTRSQLWRADYGTGLRDAAGLLTLAVEAGSQAIDIDALTSRVASQRQSLSTQESVWSLMAAHALIDDDTGNGLSVDGTPLTGPLVRGLADDIAAAPMLVRNDGEAPQNVTVTAIGVPDYQVTEGGYGYAIDRGYFAMDGTPMDPTQVHTGDRFVAVLTIEPFEEGGARLMVNDPLPAGFEIDNPNLLASGDLRELDWLDTAEATSSEFRSDRFLAAVDWRSDDTFQLAYVVRAVSPGTYHHPAASVEDMYRPQYRANTDAIQLVVRD
ncbi:MAG: alpha-2-macroglobulin family protein [Shimia sp.]|uniref:alpha-2-macroglobulin family protein n=1 Tax=Shimia sp. TaxID=1954381 RepID=UPI0040587CE9